MRLQNFSLLVLPACIVGTARSAHAQITQQSISPTVATTSVNLLFHGGLKASAVALPSSGPVPLTSVVLTWLGYPNASGYRVLRQAGTVVNGSTVYSPYVVVTPTALAGSATSYAAGGFPPSAPIRFRIVALVNGLAVDTTTGVVTTTAPLPPPNCTYCNRVTSDTLPDFLSYQIWGPPTSYSTTYGVVIARQCSMIVTAMQLVWSRNPGASRYRVQLAPGNVPLNGYSRIVTDTLVQLSTVFNGAYGNGSGSYSAYVKPEFLVRDWPGPGQTYVQPGAWVYFGQAAAPSLYASKCIH